MINDKLDQLRELGRIHGMKGKLLPSGHLAGLSATEYGAYSAGVQAGQRKVENTATVDARHLRVA